MVCAGLSALVGQSICLCPSICLLSLIDCLFFTLPSIQVRQLIVYPCVYQFRPSATRPSVIPYFFVFTFIAPSFAPSPFYVSFVILIAVIVVLFIIIFVSYCLFTSFFYFPPFSTICLSVGFSVSVPLRAHILHYIHPRFVPASNFSKKWYVACKRIFRANERLAHASE